MQKLGFRSKNPDPLVDQDLNSFYNSIKMSEAQWLVGETKHYWHNYGMQLID